MRRTPLVFAAALLLLAIASLLPLSRAQYAFLTYRPETCPAQRFDIASLQCAACPANSAVAYSGAEECTCNAGYKKVASLTDKYIFTCDDCAVTSQAAKRDRSGCMGCAIAFGATLDTTTRECTCAAGWKLAEADEGGTEFSDGKHCVQCAGGTMVDAYTCVTCPTSQMSIVAGVCTCPTDYSQVVYGESSTCVHTTTYASVTGIYPPDTAAQMKYLDVAATDDTTGGPIGPAIVSHAIRTYFGWAATDCWTLHERRACQALANMCVLQKYHPGSFPCSAFNAIHNAIVGDVNGFGGSSGNGWKTGLPFIAISTGVLYATNQFVRQEVTLSNTYTADNSRTGTMRYKLYSYAFNGTFIGSETLTTQLQLCTGDTSVLLNYLRFGTNYENSCSLDLSPYVSRGANETIFYELWLLDTNNQEYPLPVKILNQRTSDGSTPNRQGDGSEATDTSNVLSRRFYIVDTLSGRDSFSATSPKVISWMQSCTLRVEMQGSSTSQIRPPLLVIGYAERRVEDIIDGGEKGRSQVSFTAEYVKDSSSFDRAVLGLFITALVLSLFMVIRRIWVWQRKTGSEVLEINVLMFVRFIIYLYSSLGDLFFIMLCCLTFYCWLFYKGQQTVYYLLPHMQGSEVNQLRSFIVVCFVAKCVDVAFQLYAQIQIDIFFMDWEKPKGWVGDAAVGDAAPSDEEAHGGQPPTVSVWRKLFAANKWNDLQSTRLINVPLTLFFMIFLLEPSGIGLKYLATAQPSPSNLASTAAPLHPILLFAVVVFFMLCTCYLQLLFHKQILHRYYKDEAAQFVDLLCTSNISCMILDEKQHGWYIHGKTVHPYADVSLEEMNAAILAEEKNLTRARGLDVDGAGAGVHAGSGGGKDTFEFYSTHAWRATYDDLYTRLLQKQAVHQARAARSAARGNMDMSSEVEMGRAGGSMRAGGRDAEFGGGHALDSAHLITTTLMKANASLNAWLTSFINREPQFPYPYDHAVHDLPRKILGLPVALPHNAPCTMFDDPDFRFTSVLMCGIEPDLILFLTQLYALCAVMFNSILVATLVCFIVDRIIMAMRAHWGQVNLARKTLLDDRFLI